MKKLALVVAAAFVFGVIFSAAQAAYAKEYKIGYVDLAKVFEEYKNTKTAEKALEEKGKAKEADRKKLLDELKKLKDDQALLSEKAKAEKQGAIDAKVKALQDFDAQARNDLMKDRNDSLGVIMKDIEKVVNDYAKASGYDLVLNSRTLLYGADEYDLTTQILAKLNK